jgi:VIT1/CCC1 family predicted Fe2+/Mn2+ transporter
MNEETGLARGLLDFKLKKYISRQVIASVYTFFFFFIIVATPFATYAGYKEGAKNYPEGTFQPILALIIVGIPVLAFGLIIMLRLYVERYIAIVNTAENTEGLRATPID